MDQSILKFGERKITSSYINTATNSCYFPSAIPPIKSLSSSIIVKGDSAASKHYFADRHKHCLLNVKKEDGPEVTIPNSSTLKSTEGGHLPLHN